MNGCRDKRFEEMLWAYEVGLLDENDRSALELHVLECESCRLSLLQFDETARLIRHDPDIHRAIHEVAVAGSEKPAPSGLANLLFRMHMRPAYVPALLAAAVIIMVFVLRPWHIEFHPTQEAVAVENRLAVMYFDNLAEPGDPHQLGEIAANLLITDLSASSYLQVISGQRLYDILKLLGREGQKQIDRDIAREVADTARADLMLLGSILQVQPYYIITAQLTEAATGNIIGSQRVVGETGEDIFGIVDRLTVQIKNNLSLPAGAAREPDRLVAEVTTSSPDAYRSYLEGVEYLNKMYLPEAAECFSNAVKLDSSFAMACYYLAGLTDRTLIQKAVEHLDRAGLREQYYIRSRDAAFRGDTRQAITILKDAVKRFPDEKEAFFSLGAYSTSIGDYTNAIGYFNKALAIDPLYKNVYNVLAYAYDRLGEYEKAISAIDTYISLAPDEANPYDTRGEICTRNGRIDQAIESFTTALRIKPDFYNSLLNLGNLYLLRREYTRAESLYTRLADHADPGMRTLGRFYLPFIPLVQGKFAEALRLLDKGLAADSAEGQAGVNVAFKHFIKSRIYVALGECGPAIEEFETELEIFRRAEPASPVADLNIFTLLLVECGKTADAEDVAQKLKEDLEAKGDAIGPYLFARGCIELAAGNTASAIDFFQKTTDTWDDYPVRFMLARASLAAGRVAEAVNEFEGLQATYDKWRVFWTIWDVQSYYYLGTAYEASNWNDKALEQYETFLSLWQDVDHESEMVRDAKMRVAKLQKSI